MNSFFISGSCLCETMKLSNPSPGYINFNSRVFSVFEMVTEITFLFFTLWNRFLQSHSVYSLFCYLCPHFASFLRHFGISALIGTNSHSCTSLSVKSAVWLWMGLCIPVWVSFWHRAGSAASQRLEVSQTLPSLYVPRHSYFAFNAFAHRSILSTQTWDGGI